VVGETSLVLMIRKPSQDHLIDLNKINKLQEIKA